MSAGGVVPLWQGQNHAGKVTSKLQSDGTLSLSGSLRNGSGSATLFTDTANTRVGIGTASPKVLLEVAGVMSGQSLVVSSLKTCSVIYTNSQGKQFCGGSGSGGTTYTAGQGLTLAGASFKVNATLTGSLARFLTVSGSTVFAKTLLSTSGSLKVLGNISGATLNVNSLKNCDTIDTDANGLAACGTDADTNTTYTAGKGLTLTSTSFSTNTTLTGTLIRFTTVSGSTVYAKSLLGSSGALSVDGASALQGNLAFTGFQTCTLKTSSTGNVLCGSDIDTDTNTTYTAGQGMTLAGTSFKVNSTLTGSLARFTTLSGSTVFANYALSTSGSSVVRGTMIGSGGTLTLGRIGASTYSTLQHFMNFAESPGVTSGGVITVSGTTYIVGAGNGFIKATDSNIAQLNFMKWSGSSAVLATNSALFLGVDYNSGSPKIISKTTDTFDLDTQFPLGVVVNDAGTLYKMGNDWRVGDTIANMIERFDSDAAISRDARLGGLTIGNTGTRKITVSAGALLARLSEFSIAALDTSASSTFDTYYRDGASGWTKATGVTQWDNTNYDDGDGTLGSVSAIQYASKWFYLMSDGTLAMLYGQTVNTAVGTIITSDTPPSTVPDRIGKTGLLIGRIVFQGSVDAPIAVQSAFTTAFNPTLVTDHGNLSGLSDDDHTQYALLAGRSAGQTLIGGTATTDDLILQTTAASGIAGADMIFKGGNNGATEFIRILNSGNVGIGTASPKVLFEVAGAMSGQTLTVSTRKTCTLLYTNGGGQVFCGGSGSGGSTYTAGQGLTLTSGSFKTNSTQSGSLSRFTTISGSTVLANVMIRDSGSLVLKKYAGTSTGNILIVDTKGLIYDATNKRVGIGTSSPRTALEVIGSISGSNLFSAGIVSASGAGVFKGNVTTKGSFSGSKLLLSAGTASLPSLTFNNDTNAGFYWIGADILGISTAATERVRIDASGNVGIGTTSPKVLLEVAGSLSGSALTLSRLSKCGGLSTLSSGAVVCGIGINNTSSLKIAPTGSDDATVGTQVWNNPTRVTSSDNSYATNLLAGAASVTENSIKLVKGGVVTGNDKSTGAALPQNSPDVYRSYGGALDMWGATLTPADVNASNFGVGVSYAGDTTITDYLFATNFGFSIPSNALIDGIKAEAESDYTVSFDDPTVRVDHIRITVYYSTPLDRQFVNISGDTMTGALVIQSGSVLATTNRTLLTVNGGVYSSSLWVNGTGSSPILSTNVGFGRVGIGTTIPHAKLDVIGTISGSLLTQNGAGVNYLMGSLSLGKTTVTNSVALDVVGTISGSLLTLNSSASANNYITGNLSLGKTTPRTKLEVAGTISGRLLTQNGAGSNYFRGNVGLGVTAPTTLFQMSGGIFTFRSYHGNPNSYMNITDGTHGGYIDVQSGDLHLYTDSASQDIVLQGSPGSQGNVGVGNANPRQKLDVVGTISGSLLSINGGSAGLSYLLGNVSIGKTTITSGVALDVVGTVSGSLLTINGGTSGISYIRGNVSIGTATNKAKLDVAGTMSGQGLVLNGGTRGRAITRILSGSKVVDIASTATLVCNASTLSVTGALVNDPVALGIPNASMSVAGSFTAWVSATNVVSVRYCNNTAGTLDPVAGNFRAVVTQF